MISAIFSRIFLFFVFLFCSFAQQELSTILQKAKSRIDIMTPGIFSVSLVDVLCELYDKGIHVRILLDTTFIDDPQQMVSDLPADFPVRIHPQKKKIPFNLVILDQKEVFLGGDFFDDHKTKIFKFVEIKDAQDIFSYIQNYQKFWEETNESESLKYLSRQAFLNEVEAIGPQPGNPVQEAGFIASRHRKVYHRAGSPAAKKILPENRLWFATEEEAKKSGRKPAKSF